MVDISVVVPVFNEDDVIEIFLGAVTPIISAISEDFEILFVNDGSKDRTLPVLLAARERDSRIKIIDFSRNFGKEAALSAALDFTTGKVVIPIDVDLQDPPELIPQMVQKWREGYDVVLARRNDRSNDSFIKRTASQLFYRVIGRLSDIDIPNDVGDFRLMDRKVVEALRNLPERARFMKGLFAWLGFRQATVSYARTPRVAGTTKWKPFALWTLGLEGIISFSSAPLKLWSYLGVACATAGLFYGVFLLGRVLIEGADVPGYASLASFTLFTNGLVLLSLGVMGEYMARIFLEVKARPLYLVRSAWGLDPEETGETGLRTLDGDAVNNVEEKP